MLLGSNTLFIWGESNLAVIENSLISLGEQDMQFKPFKI